MQIHESPEYLHDIETLCCSENESRRVRFLIMMSEEPTPAGKLASELAVSARTVQRWQALYTANGLAGLLPRISHVLASEPEAKAGAPSRLQLVGFLNALPDGGELTHMLGDLAARFGKLLFDVDFVAVAPDLSAILSDGTVNDARPTVLDVRQGTETIHVGEPLDDDDLVDWLSRTIQVEGVDRGDLRPPHPLLVHDYRGVLVAVVMLWRRRNSTPTDPETIRFAQSLTPFLAHIITGLVLRSESARPSGSPFFASAKHVVEEKGLSRTEHKVLLALLRLGSIERAARALSLSPETVKWHSKRIYRKTGVAGLPELFAAYFTPAAENAEVPGS